MKQISLITCLLLPLLVSCTENEKIDRRSLLERNNPVVSELNPLHSLNIGNGKFAAVMDATGLQTFPQMYSEGLSLGTYSQWGWHSYPNTEGYRAEEILENHPLPGHPQGVYAVQKGLGMSERSQAAAEWIRANPHRLHLGNVGFEDFEAEAITGINQTLHLYDGSLESAFRYKGHDVRVSTVCGGEGEDQIAARIVSDTLLNVTLRFPYPSGGHTDDGCNWDADSLHSSVILSEEDHSALIKRVVDSTEYYVALRWDGVSKLERLSENAFALKAGRNDWNFNVRFSPVPVEAQSYAAAEKATRRLWNEYWDNTGIIDFSQCTDPRAPLLERRVVLSQYLIRSQEAQDYPPAETGLTYNSWYGKFHLEMVMWHSFHYALWNQPQLLERQLDFYLKAMDNAREIASRQGFEGVRWMKMTDPSAIEAPSDIGSFIIWQQPHPIYMAELLYRAAESEKEKSRILEKYSEMVAQSAAFMASFVSYDAENDRYIIQGACAANESYNEEATLNPAFEMAYWHFGLSTAQKWRERSGMQRDSRWDGIMEKLAPLSTSPDGIYLPAEKGPGIPDFKTMTIPVSTAAAAPAGGYVNGQRPKGEIVYVKPSKRADGRDPFYVRGTSSENLLAYGMLPASPLVEEEPLQATLQRASENWNWNGGNWSWNYPTLVMNATRLSRSDIALRAATMNDRSDLLLPSGNNYRSQTLRMYLPGNGGLLLAVGMMCAGYDGCTEINPGFPKDGGWNVRWEGLKPLP